MPNKKVANPVPETLVNDYQVKAIIAALFIAHGTNTKSAIENSKWLLEELKKT